MRKVGGLFFILLVLSLSFSSAGWFSDTWGRITGDSVSCLRCANSTHNVISKIDYKVNYTVTSSEVSLPVGGLVLTEDSTKKINIPSIDVDYVNFTGQVTGSQACKVHFIWKRGSYISATNIISLESSISTVKRAMSSSVGGGVNSGAADSIRLFTSQGCSKRVVLYNISLIGRPLYNTTLFYGNLTLQDISTNGSSFVLSKPAAIKELSIDVEKISRSSSFCSVVVKYIYEDNTSQVFNNLISSNSRSFGDSMDSQYKTVTSIEIFAGYHSFFSMFRSRDCSDKLRLVKLSASVLTINATDPDFGEGF